MSALVTLAGDDRINAKEEMMKTKQTKEQRNQAARERRAAKKQPVVDVPNWEAADAMVAELPNQPEPEPMDVVTVTVPAKTAAQIAAAAGWLGSGKPRFPPPDWDEIEKARESGALKTRLIKAVKEDAEGRLADDDDASGRFSRVLELTDDAIWSVVQNCDLERGAINRMSHHMLAEERAKKLTEVPA